MPLPGNSVIQDSSITPGADGLGLIAYHYSPWLDLRIDYCSNRQCDSATFYTPNNGIKDGYQASITTRADGRGLLTHAAFEPTVMMQPAPPAPAPGL